jgi:hypothetical protein
MAWKNICHRQYCSCFSYLLQNDTGSSEPLILERVTWSLVATKRMQVFILACLALLARRGRRRTRQTIEYRHLRIMRPPATSQLECHSCRTNACVPTSWSASRIYEPIIRLQHSKLHTDHLVRCLDPKYPWTVQHNSDTVRHRKHLRGLGFEGDMHVRVQDMSSLMLGKGIAMTPKIEAHGVVRTLDGRSWKGKDIAMIGS